MIVAVAKNYQEFEEWLRQNFVYVGDKFTLEKINPNDVEEIVFVGDGFRDHPIYFSDEFLDFQFRVAESKFKPKKSWFRRFL